MAGGCPLFIFLLMTTQKDIVVFDLETTGKSITKDRAIQIAALKIDHNYNIKEPIRCIMINPQMPIDPEAIETHGITNEMVADKPPFAAFKNALFTFFDGCDLAGFNSNRFDIPLLSEEFARYDMEWPHKDANFIDVFKIYILKEKRDLAAAVKFYTGKELDGAHDAGNDVMGTYEVLKSQLIRYEDLKGMTNREIELFCSDGQQRVDVAGKIILGPDGQPAYGFGKDEGKNIKANPGFGDWMLRPGQDFPTSTKKMIKQIIYGKGLW